MLLDGSVETFALFTHCSKCLYFLPQVKYIGKSLMKNVFSKRLFLFFGVKDTASFIKRTIQKTSSFPILNLTKPNFYTSHLKVTSFSRLSPKHVKKINNEIFAIIF